MSNNAPVVPCPECGHMTRKNTLPRHLPVCLGSSPCLADLYRIGEVVEGEGGCHEWGKKTNEHGYGLLPDVAANQVNERKSHRAAWVLYHGEPVPEGLFVLHHCDNPPCLNPEHLYVGTYQDNGRDMMARGRGGGQFQRKEREVRACLICGGEFEVLPSSSVKTCSLSCAAKQSWVTKPDRAIHNRSDGETRTCLVCGIEFWVARPSSRKKTCGSSYCVGQQRWRMRR